MFGGGKKPTTKDAAKGAKREITRSQRDLDRERASLEREEKKIERDIKKYAKDGNQKAVKMMAKQLIQTRKQRDRLIGMKVQMGAIKNQTTQMAASAAMVGAMQTAGRAMTSANKAVDIQGLQQTLQQFQMESEKADFVQESMEDMMDMFDEEEDEEEADEVMNKVLDEIGLDLGALMADAPTNRAGMRVGETSDASETKQAPSAVAAGLL